MSDELKAALLARIAPGPLGCWLWTGCISDHGYGRLSWERKPAIAHRLSYQTFKGEIPSGKHIDHLCRVRNCVNPDHLEAVSRRTNILRGIGITAVNMRKTHCNKGHAYADHAVKRANGNRTCGVCRKEWTRANYQRHRESIIARRKASKRLRAADATRKEEGS